MCSPATRLDDSLSRPGKQLKDTWPVKIDSLGQRSNIKVQFPVGPVFKSDTRVQFKRDCHFPIVSGSDMNAARRHCRWRALTGQSARPRLLIMVHWNPDSICWQRDNRAGRYLTVYINLSAGTGIQRVHDVSEIQPDMIVISVDARSQPRLNGTRHVFEPANGPVKVGQRT